MDDGFIGYDHRIAPVTTSLLWRWDSLILA